jgi:N6-adenosine-specific RNA methylase IME4
MPAAKPPTTSPAADTTQALQFHPLANCFPLIEGDEFRALVEDIRKPHGLREPVVLYEGLILDGRNRYRACEAAGVDCRFEQYTGDDPIGFVVSLNLRRRHLDESQRAMVAAKLATLRDGQRSDLVQGLPIGRASTLLNVGERSVARAREVLDHGVPELRQAVERGEVSVSAAADVSMESAEAQQEIVARGEREILRAAKSIRARLTEERIAARMERHAAIAMSMPMPKRRYPVLLVDPPWPFELYNERSGSERVAANHYPTMSVEEISALDIPAAADAVLFLWTTRSHLRVSFDVLTAWGFEYVTNVAWIKDKAGLGFWVRDQHEHLLIARRGNIPAPQPSDRPPSVIHAPRREHSRKPDETYALIERMYPELPKIELFARERREGWDAWGNQAPPAAAASDELREVVR